MKKILLTIDKSKKNQMVKNLTYTTSNNYSNKIFPVPDFIENKCKCGNIGFGMDNNLNILCIKCLTIPSIKEINEEDFMEPNIDIIFNYSKIKWSIVGKDNEYTVYGKNIIVDSERLLSLETLNDMFNILKNNIINGRTELVDGLYNIDNKKLTVYF